MSAKVSPIIGADANRAGWRPCQGHGTAHRRDYAGMHPGVVDVFPQAKQIELVQDNLNTHDGCGASPGIRPGSGAADLGTG